jgi:hypothetical protein
MPITACDLLCERTVLTDNGREFCGKLESHPFERTASSSG